MLLRNKKKVLCYVLVFDQVEIIEKCLKFICKDADRLEIVVIENPSQHTPEISKFINKLGKDGLIARYYLFDSNITNNAFKTVFKTELDEIKKRKYILQTDGDVTSKDKDWLDEELKIMDNNKDVFACGISLDMSNLPIKAFPEAASWIPEDINTYDDYYEAVTGTHLLMHRGKEFYKLMQWAGKNNVHLIDNALHDYSYRILKMKYARTKKAKAYHLTWDLYADKNNSYTKYKDKKGFNKLWNHERVDSYKLTKY
ncbi:MAG: hypothetical protein WDN66_01755 [Candidatus Saccharibacteria bacterium]